MGLEPTSSPLEVEVTEIYATELSHTEHNYTELIYKVSGERMDTVLVLCKEVTDILRHQTHQYITARAFVNRRNEFQFMDLSILYNRTSVSIKYSLSSSKMSALRTLQSR